ncbi:MAG: NUDIX domain-containing protein [Oscillospiraceae bacterium]|nr:NUDIX domain-containing protein [Oscillospiraceae bacterium]
MHKIFGNKLQGEYYTRAGAYLIPISNGKIAVVKTPKGYFFIGGGYENDETDAECITRECIEETGYFADIGELICSAETYTFHNKVGLFHPVQYYYTGTLTEKISEQKEKDHQLEWITLQQLKGKMFSEMQNWALEYAFDKLK